MSGNIWLVGHPTHQYAEDIKALARQHGLIVVDEAVATDADRERACDKPPKLTKVGDKRAAKAQQESLA